MAKSAIGNVLLTGTARPLPYADLFSPGANQLERIADAYRSRVPGLDESSFFNELTDVRITDNNTVWFRAIAEDSGGQVDDYSGLWNAVPGSDAAPVIDYSLEFAAGAEPVSLTRIISYFVSEQGDVVVHGEFDASDDFSSRYRDVLIYRRGSK